MKVSFNSLHNVSFGKVIPVKKIVFDNDSTINYEQLTIDCCDFSSKESVDTSCDPDTAKKVIQTLNRILLKNDGAEKNTFKNALHNMIRSTFASVDKDYKVPVRPVESSDNSILKPCYTAVKNYILTGKEAREYAVAGKNIGGARALVRDFNESNYTITRSKKDFASCKTDILMDTTARLKGEYGQNLGLVIYADKVNVPKKGSKGVKTEINIRGIDFEAL